MKKILITISAITFFSSVTYAADHSKMHDMMMKQGGPKSDDRIELTVHEPVKIMHKGMMRQHMDTVSEILAALAENKLDKAAIIATSELGWSEERGEQCATFEPDKERADFTKLSTAMHKQANKLAEAAKAGERDQALSALAELITRCNDCHKVFRH